MCGGGGGGGGGVCRLAGGCVWVRLVCSPCGVRSLCFTESVSARASMGGGTSRALLWHVYCEHHYAL